MKYQTGFSDTREYTKGRILLVEDNEDNRFVAEIYLSLEGYDVISTTTAVEAKRLYHLHSFDLFIFDVRLPDENGIELCRYICQLDPSHIVILFSAAARVVDKEAGLSAGAKAYLIKPNDFDRLAEVVAHFLKQKLDSQDEPCIAIEVKC